MRRIAWLFVLAALAGGCGRASRREGASASGPPKGDAIWLTDPAAAADAGLDAQLQRLGVSAVFLPAGEVAFERGRWEFRQDREPPPSPARPPVMLVVRAGPELSSGLSASSGADLEAAAHAMAGPLSRASARGGPWGRVAGVHLDFPFAFAAAGRYAGLARALRRELPAGTFLTVSLHRTPASAEEAGQLEPLLGAVDGLVAFVFGVGDRADATRADGLHRPWWAAFDTTGTGNRIGETGGAESAVPETYLDRLVGHPRIEFENDLSVVDPSVTAFVLEARGPIRLDGLTLAAGDRVSFHLPALSEMLYRMGSAMAGRRFALGRVVVFGGASEAERIVPVAALEDILLGRPLLPVIQVEIAPAGRDAVSVAAANRTWHASTVSRLANWVEVDLGAAHPSDVELGGFDRFEVYDRDGRAVSPGRATRVRLFETLVSPMEAISPARVVVRGRLPADCCRYRTRIVAATGQELAGDWSAAPPTPAPAPGKPFVRGKAK